MRVLYLHPAGAFGGASKSLIELYKKLKERGVGGTVLTPRGSAVSAFLDAGLDVKTSWGLSQFDSTLYGHYRGVRWLILLRELVFLPGSLRSIWALRSQQFDILHVNEVTLLPLALVAKWLLKLPMVVHVRSLQCMPEASLRSRFINYCLSQFADVVIPIDYGVANTIKKSLNIKVVHNGLVMKTNSSLNACKIINPNRKIRVGFMGVLIPLKGVYELLDAFVILKKRCIDVECIIVGENARNLSGVRAWLLNIFGFYHDVRANLKSLIIDNELEDNVKLLGFVSDVHQIYSTLDILCFPSHLNAAGRPVFEAAFYGVPSIVAVDNPLPDAILHGVTGLAIPRPDPKLIADAIQRMVEDEQLRFKMGNAASVWAVKNFSIASAASEILNVYVGLINKRARI